MVLLSLRDDVFPVFEATMRQRTAQATGSLLEDYPPPPLLKAFGEWQERWHLDDGWVSDAAERQLLFWLNHPPQKIGADLDRLQWTHGKIRVDDYPALSMRRHGFFTFSTDAYEPTWCTRESYKTTVLAYFERSLREYLDAADAQAAAVEHNLKRTKPEYRALQQHMVAYSAPNRSPRTLHADHPERRMPIRQYGRCRSQKTLSCRSVSGPRAESVIGMGVFPRG